MKALTREKRREKAEKEKQKNWKKGEKGEGKEKETLSAILYYQISYEQIIFRLRPRRRSGLVYFGARYYDPRIGRFITPDPSLGGRMIRGCLLLDYLLLL